MYVTRKEDWRWEISNNFCTYKSIPDAADKKDGTGPFFQHLELKRHRVHDLSVISHVTLCV
ncbi:hypothetical protein H5410_048764 [Solanum commersonii]|uniref:Uncharacterized protein n=1 Tax=Solanum commersonii TaxID=4109 RepID=A0A9J5XKQ3_SOLCO|nr:hypothetical protein H5410_048764 [Solanum commersonii]